MNNASRWGVDKAEDGGQGKGNGPRKEEKGRDNRQMWPKGKIGLHLIEVGVY